MGSGESRSNVSLVVRDSHKTMSTDHNISSERRAKTELTQGPAYQPNALQLGQTGSLLPTHGAFIWNNTDPLSRYKAVTQCQQEKHARLSYDLL